MESQILYESLTKPRCDLDSNMNKTTIKDPENADKSNVNTDILAGDIISSNEGESNQKEERKDVAAEDVPRSKLLDQLQMPLGPPTINTYCTSGLPLPTIEENENVSEDKNSNTSISTDVSNSNNPDKVVADDAGGAGSSSVPVQNSALVISTAQSTTDVSSLASPSPSVSSGRSMSMSPLPSPGTSAISGHEVSSSKSVTGKIKKRRRRGSAWTDAETEYLMEVWARQADLIKIKGGDESVTCAPVYRLISKSMADQGWDKTWEQCKTRIHTLKRAYKITKDEITEGCQTITYCRHFDILEIISGDNSQMSPGMIAATLEQKRRQRQYEGASKKQPVRRKLTVGENPKLAKKQNLGNNVVKAAGFQQLPVQNSVSSAPIYQSNTITNTTWSTPVIPQQFQQQPVQCQLQQSEQQTQQLPAVLNDVQLPSQQPLQSSELQVNSHGEGTPSASGNETTHAPPYVNTVNSDAQLKGGITDTQNTSSDNSTKRGGVLWNALSTPQKSNQTTAHARQSPGSDLERMRLNLEMRKLEVERGKLEMEERQRREDRDHQYRMMQLLLFGLGQQNISQELAGQGSDVAHAHDAVLSRALEHGLVPGGSQKANEKGLSFSEL